MFTVGLNSVKITLLNAVTLTAQLVLGPSTSVSEMCICEAKLTSCSTSCETTHRILPRILTCFKLQIL
jgi:hypothetical protein